MLLFKTLQFFLLPSVFSFFFILIGAILIYIKKGAGKVAWFFLIFGIASYYCFSITAVSNFLINGLESRYLQLPESKFFDSDRAVLLLGGQDENIIRSSEVLRIYFGRLGGQGNKFQTIVSGADPIKPNEDLALSVKKFLIDRGVAKESILVDSASRTTFESAQNLEKILGKEPFFLVTAGYHMPRAVESFKKLGMSPIPAPTNFKTGMNSNYILNFIPDVGNLGKSNLALHEYFGILYYESFLL